MKKVYIFWMFCWLVNPFLVKAQFLKNILNDVKQTTQNRANEKASNATNKIIDKVDKSNTPQPSTSNTSGQLPTAAPQTGNTPAAPSSTNTHPPPNDPYNSDKSFINLKLSSSKILVGGTVIVSGSSIMFGTLKQVAMAVTGPSVNETKNIALKDSGVFETTWQAATAGNYTITVTSSDGKAKQAAPLSVYRFIEMDSLTKENTKATQKAYDHLKKCVDQVKTSLVEKDADELQKKMDDVTKKKDKVLQLFTDLTDAGKGLDGIEKKYGAVPPNVSANLSQLGNLCSQQAAQMEQANTIADHQPSENSVCEYLVMVSEACAAFSTFTNVFTKSISVIVKNIVLDKGVSTAAGSASNSVGIASPMDNATKESAKLFATANLDAASFSSYMGTAGFTGDIAQMCSNLLLKKYCAVMSGDLSQTYQCTFENSGHNVWWQYSYTTAATISLRYPKNNAGGKIIKMKGNIEGNATKFKLYQNMEEMDDFKNAMKNRAKLYPVCVYSPPTVPFASSQADKNTGFGAVARAIATPAYFNIPIDADYDVEQKKLKIYVNDAIMDFGPQVCYIYCYLAFAAGIPLSTRVNFPINKVKLTLGKVIQQNNDFDVQTDANNNLFISGKGDFKIGQNTDIAHSIQFSFSLKSD